MIDNGVSTFDWSPAPPSTTHPGAEMLYGCLLKNLNNFLNFEQPPFCEQLMLFYSLKLYWFALKIISGPSDNAMENFKALEAKKYVESSWIQSVKHLWVSPEVFLAKSLISPSYRVSSKPYQTWVALNKDADVLFGHCTCMAGLVELNNG